MIHTALLVCNRGEYRFISPKIRKKIFYSLYSYIKKIDINFFSIMIDKKYIDTKETLENKITRKLSEIFYKNQNFFNKYDKVILKYDKGQKDYYKILNNSLNTNLTNYEIIKNFDKVNERLFQVVDFITYIDKLNYSLKNKIRLTNSEKQFLSEEEIKKIVKEINKKRL